MPKLEWMDELKQQTIEYFDTTRAGFVKGSKGRFGLANILKTGEVTITDRSSLHASENSESKSWNYDSVKSMVADGWWIDET